MNTVTFEQRCTLAQNSLPKAEYRTWLTALHTDMLARIAELEVCWSACEGLDIDQLARFGLGSATGSEIHRLREQNAELLARIAKLEKSINEDELHQAFIDSLPQDDEKMHMQIDAWARQSYKRHQNSVRGQQITHLDSFDTHVVLATLQWVKTNGEIK